MFQYFLLNFLLFFYQETFQNICLYFLPLFLLEETIPNFISPEQIEFVAAYCLFSFSTFGVEKIATGRITRDRAKDVPALKDVP